MKLANQFNNEEEDQPFSGVKYLRDTIFKIQKRVVGHCGPDKYKED
jgi:hypothetical protein